MSFADTIPLVWPLAFVLVALFVMRKVGDDLRPIVNGVVGGLAKNASQHALGYAMASLLATLGCLQELAAVATDFHWVYVAAFAKVLQPGLAAIVGYVIKPPAFTQAKDPVLPTGTTANPFPPSIPATP